MKRIYPLISNKRFEEIMMILTTPHVSVKHLFDNQFVEEALKVKITNRLVGQFKREYEKLKISVKA